MFVSCYFFGLVPFLFKLMSVYFFVLRWFVGVDVSPVGAMREAVYRGTNGLELVPSKAAGRHDAQALPAQRARVADVFCMV